GVGGAPAVAQQECPSGTVREGLLLLGVPVDRAGRVEADVAVGVDQPGDDPDRAEAGGDVGGAGDGLVRDAPVRDVQVALLALGEHDAAYAQGLRHAPTVSSRVRGT